MRPNTTFTKISANLIRARKIWTGVFSWFLAQQREWKGEVPHCCLIWHHTHSDKMLSTFVPRHSSYTGHALGRCSQPKCSCLLAYSIQWISEPLPGKTGLAGDSKCWIPAFLEKWKKHKHHFVTLICEWEVEQLCNYGSPVWWKLFPHCCMSVWSCAATSITQEQICWRLVSSPVQAQGERKSSGAPPAARHWQAAAWARAASSLGCWPPPACSRGGPVVLCPDVKGKKNKKEISALISVFLEFKKDNTCLFVWRWSKNHNLSVLFSSWSARLTIEPHLWQPLSLLISGCTSNAFDQLQQLWMKSHLAPFANDMSCWSVLCIFFFLLKMKEKIM